MNAQNVDQVAFMSVESNAKEPIKVQAEDSGDAMQLVLNNRHIPQTILKLDYPGQSKYWKVQSKNISGPFVVGFGLADKIQEHLQLEVYMRYSKPPTADIYDVRLNINWNNLSPSKQISKVGKATVDILCSFIDDKSFVCDPQKSSSTDGPIWFSATYDGPMPPKKLVENKHSHSIEKHTNYLNFTSTMYVPSCMYWNSNKNSYDTNGLEVSYLMNMRIYSICIMFQVKYRKDRNSGDIRSPYN